MSRIEALEDRMAKLEQHLARLSHEPRHSITDQIIELVAEYYRFDVTAMLGRERTGRIVTARWVAMWLMRELLKHSLMRIGGRFGRDHGTVLHGIEALTAQASVYPDVAKDMKALRVKAELLLANP